MVALNERAGVVMFVVVSAFATHFSAEVLPPGLKIERLLDSGVELGQLAQSPGGELWLLERTTGTIRVLVAGVEDVLLTVPVASSCEGGLLDVAFAPDYAKNGRAFVSLVDPAGYLVVREVLRRPGGLTVTTTLLQVGQTSGCRPGGGLVLAADGTLYVGVGDLETSSAAQDDASLAGKLLRVNLDGSIPADNPDPVSPVFAKGFRHPAALSLNSDTGRSGGTLYAVDRGDAGLAPDELNVVTAAGNYGWSVVSGNSSGVYDDPLLVQQPGGAAEALTGIRRAGLGDEHRGSLLYTDGNADELRQVLLTGNDLDQLDATRPFYDPDGDPDGTPDAACPAAFQALLEAGDGMLYAASDGVDPGIWRVYADLPGPREVSPPGSPFSLWAEKAGGADLRLSWEQLESREAGRPARHGGQHPHTYQIWEGTLPIAGTYDHQSILTTDGLPAGPARRSATITPGSGSRYYLVSAQADNLEGTTGRASDGAPRGPQGGDYCSTLSRGNSVGQCVDEFRDVLSGEPTKLVDYNPNSPTYLRSLSVDDFRGKVVHLEIAAADCFWCILQAPTLPPVESAHRDRDFVILTVMNASEFVPRPFADAAACASGIAGWAETHGGTHPIVCDVDVDADGKGDVSEQYWHSAVHPDPCGGFGQNLFIDQGGVIFDYVCSFVSGDEVAAIIGPEVNPESCE